MVANFPLQTHYYEYLIFRATSLGFAGRKTYFELEIADNKLHCGDFIVLVHKKASSTQSAETFEAQDVAQKPKPALKSRLIAVIAVATAAIGNVFFEASGHARITSEYARAEESARSTGIPTTRAEFEELMPQVPNSQNSEGDFESIRRAMGGINFKKSWETNPVEGYRLSPEQQRLLDIVKDASTKEGLRLHYDWDNVLEGLPLFGVVRTSCEALATNAEVQAYQGHTDTAVQELGQAYKLRDQIAAQPILISQLIAQGLSNRIDSAALGVASTSPSLLPSIFDLIKKKQFTPSFEKTYKGEIYFAERLAKLIRSYRELQTVRSENYDLKFAEQLQSNAGKPLTDFQKRILVDFFNGWVEIFQRYSHDPNLLPLLDAQLRDESSALARKFFTQPLINSFIGMQENAKLHDRFLRAAEGVLKYRSANGGALPAGIPAEAGSDYKALDSDFGVTQQPGGFSITHRAKNRVLNVHTGFIPDQLKGKKK